jgi:hypothetical protein
MEFLYHFISYCGCLFLAMLLLEGRRMCNIFLRHFQWDACDSCRNFCLSQAYLESESIPQKHGCLWSLIARGSLRSQVFNFDQLAPLSDTLMPFVTERLEKEGWCFAISELNLSIFTVYRQTLRHGTHVCIPETMDRLVFVITTSHDWPPFLQINSVTFLTF